MNYKPVIGLEVHVELKTKSKMFCGCSADYFGQKPNSHTCPICLGLPGALPVPNKKAIEWCIMIGLALNCNISLLSKFDRKNYFYPDLPKGYQISQYDQPFCSGGYVILNSFQDLKTKDTEMPKQVRHDTGEKRIGITRVHMEEDTGKLIHQGDSTLIDFNRSGVPLVEIVTEPDFENAKEVVEYLKKLQQIVRYLDVSGADMEKGNMRLEPNISLSPCHPEPVSGSSSSKNEMPKQVRHDNVKLPIYKVEVKNINSFRFVEKAIEFEIKRQTEILENGQIPIQETRGWDENRQKTVSQRIKEEANDYRYFPEPDIPPIRLSESRISNLKSQMPELPEARLARLIKDYSLSIYDAEILTREKEIADYFEECVYMGQFHEISPKQIANNIINKKVDIKNVLPAALIKSIVITKLTNTIDDKKLQEMISIVLSQNKKAVEDYKSGKIQVIGFLIGKVKKHFPKGDTGQIKKSLERGLN
ncbi:MAG: Asp-tRNA(Asn)/Glu-tRNA(Gln) amidotransferase subunit GatB [Candidatus Levybacteria bacterium]|nr:Asp-tRNA(Asn)/Glu-tRNA(Gln) amidotransferase subunit GatB [Candidatus Levybacteria bacterium]